MNHIFIKTSIPFPLQNSRTKHNSSQNNPTMKGKSLHFRRLHASTISFLCIVFLLSHQIAGDHDSPDTLRDPRYHRQQLMSYNGDPLTVGPQVEIENPRLRNGYIALQAWKEAMLSDPHNITGNWVGEDVCNYTGVFCWPTPEYPHELTIAAIDINHGDIAGSLVHELGLLYDIALFHLNSNRFCGVIPESFVNFRRLYELDLSNNRFAGKFPEIVLKLPSLQYLDLRFNEFEGELPRELFEKDLDAIFVNNNRFSSGLPNNIGKSRVSVIVLAHNNFSGCVPAGLGDMGETLNELILIDTGLSSCFPSEIAKLKNLTVLDLSNNKIVGPLPHGIGEMVSLEQLNLAQNMMSGRIGDQICELPNLVNFNYQNNFFSEESPSCKKPNKFDAKMNCLRDRPDQKSTLECQRFLSRTIDCNSFNCESPVDPEAPPKVLPCAPPQPPPAPTPDEPSPAPTPDEPSPAPTPDEPTPAEPTFSPPPPQTSSPPPPEVPKPLPPPNPSSPPPPEAMPPMCPCQPTPQP